MNDELIAEVIADMADMAESHAETAKLPVPGEEFPFYIVPRPPVPGKTSWSSTPC